jgi:ribosome-binding protein aMBF1 (putative translation factor)
MGENEQRVSIGERVSMTRSSSRIPVTKVPGESIVPDEHDFAAQVGEAIRRSRTALGWTQVQLATEAELSPNYVARLERGELGPSLFVATRIARAMGVPLDELLMVRKSTPPLSRSKQRVAPKTT